MISFRAMAGAVMAGFKPGGLRLDFSHGVILPKDGVSYRSELSFAERNSVTNGRR